jgi:ribulose-phosphate 3-epimerase
VSTTTAIDRRAAARASLLGTQIAPSLLAADFTRLREQVQDVLDAGAQVIHFDVMDGHFVPPITFGALIVSALSEQVHAADAILDLHLMIERPEYQIEQIASAGADLITVHYEATANLHYVLGAIRAHGCLAGAALNPGTPAELLAPVADVLDVALCMTVNPGWGGQPFIDAMLAKVSRLRELLPADCTIEVDGGITLGTAPRCAQLGATLLVAGSAIFGQVDPAGAFGRLTGAVDGR